MRRSRLQASSARCSAAGPLPSTPSLPKSDTAKGRDDRRVIREANNDGTASIIALNLGALIADRIMRRICDLAEIAKTGTDPRTIDQVRADVFVDLLIRHHTDSPPATERSGVVDIRVDLTTLAGLNESPVRFPDGGRWSPTSPAEQPNRESHGK